MPESRRNPELDLLHPAVALVYCGVGLVMAMCAMQPVYLALTLAGALAWRACLVGARRTLRGLAWQVPCALVVAAANGLFVASGATELFRVGARAFYLEAFAYGLCQGAMLVSAMLCFANAAEVLTTDKVMGLLGNAAPTVSLMLSMTLRLVPRFLARAEESRAAVAACTAAKGEAGEVSVGRPTPLRSRREAPRAPRVREAMRLSSVLLGWGLEDSLETADAMRARGWGAAPRRTTYRRERLRRTDACALAVVALLAAASGAAAWAACAGFSFYPRLRGLAPWYSYAPYALYLALPVLLHVKEVLAWN